MGICFFYSNDHTPIHAHVRKGDGKAVFSAEGKVVLRESVGMKTKELSKAEELANENRSDIVQKWNEYFN